MGNYLVCALYATLILEFPAEWDATKAALLQLVRIKWVLMTHVTFVSLDSVTAQPVQMVF